MIEYVGHHYMHIIDLLIAMSFGLTCGISGWVFARRDVQYMRHHASDCETMCDAYAKENQKLYDEVQRLRADEARVTWLVQWLSDTGLITVRSANVPGVRAMWTLCNPTGTDYDNYVGRSEADALGAIDDAIARA